MSTTYYGQHSGIVLTSGFAAKNPVTIASNGTITSGAAYNGDAIYGANYPWTLSNLGTVEGTVQYSNGIALEAGGLIVNGRSDATTALIQGGANGPSVHISGSSGTVVNSGTIESLSGLALVDFSYGIELEMGGVVVNGASGATEALIKGRKAGVHIADGSGTVINSGTIRGLTGIALKAGGTIANEPTGLVPNGVYVAGAPGTVTNLGTISGTYSSAINLQAGGSITNGESGSPIGLISGNYDGIKIYGTALALTNFGTIIGIGAAVYQHGFRTPGIGVVLNSTALGHATVTNYGTIEGVANGRPTDYALRFDGGNNLLIVEPGAFFGGKVDGRGGSNRAELPAPGGTMTGVDLSFIGLTVEIDSGASWVWAGGGTIAATSTLAVEGSLTSTGILNNSGMVTVAGSLIETSTLINAGTISGGSGTAVRFGGIGLLVADPGAVFVGTVDGDGGSWIELAAGQAPGTLNGLGKAFTGFGHLVVDAGADWQVSGKLRGALAVTNDGTLGVPDGLRLFLGAVGEDSGRHGKFRLGVGSEAAFLDAVAKGQRFVFTADTGTLALLQPAVFRAKIHGFRGGDTIDLLHRAADQVAYSPGHLVLSEGGAAVATLRLFGDFTTGDFALSPDGKGGATITLAAGDPHPPPPMMAMPDFWTIRN
jgi:hypothetical protein